MPKPFRFALLLLLVAGASYPCSTFLLNRDGEVVYGRNYDFEIAHGFLMTNRRGVEKISMDGTLRWTARYGSITFNQWGREFPMDGMNEAGLVIGLMWLDETRYPAVDARPRLRVLEWIQYQLDNHGSVSELLAHADEVRIGGGTPLHYLVADGTGAAATIEYLDGRLVVHTAANLPTANLTNDSYSRSLDYLKSFAGFGGTRRMPSGFTSLDRFARTAMRMRGADPARPLPEEAFSILADVAQPGWTRWSIVYDPVRGEVSWQTLNVPVRKTVRLDAIDLSCSATAKMLDVDADLEGEVSAAMIDYSAEVNREIVLRSYAMTSFTRGQPVSWAEADAAHADSFSCTPSSRRRPTRR